MSLKRSHAPGKSFGGGEGGGRGGARGGDGKVDRQDLFDELKRLATTGDGFSAIDVALAIGSSETLISKAFLGLAIEGLLERLDAGRYRATPMAEVAQADFVKAFARASHVDSTRQRDLSEIGRLKQNNDTMRQRLLAALAERDHYRAVLRAHEIDPGPVPTAAPAPSPASSNAEAPAAGAAPASEESTAAARLPDAPPAGSSPDSP